MFLDALHEGYSVSSFKKMKKEESAPLNLENQVQTYNLKRKVFSLSIPLVLTPTVVLAGGATGFADIHRSIMSLFDMGVVFVIIFAGAAWSLGHRSKAIEILIGVCCGYLLARHGVEIRDWLKSI